MEIVAVSASILFGYFLGAVPFGLIVARLFGISDVRSHGSGNIGATNVLRVAGLKAAIWVYLLDIGKGVLAVLVARMIHQTLMPPEVLLVSVGVATVLGHVFPIYLNFRGGKGVNTGLGVMISILPLETLFCLIVFVVVLSVSKFVSLGSMVAALALSSAVLLEKFWLRPQISWVLVGLALAMTVIILLTHRTNLKRLIAGTESKFSLRSKNSNPRESLHV